MSQNRTAIITGGGTGIGRASAIGLANDGWKVVVAGRRSEKLDEVVATAPASISAFVADVTDEPAVIELFEHAVATFGSVDLLFNNAGCTAPGAPIAKSELSDWQRVVDVNVTACFLCAREAFRHMSQQTPQGGRIINNGSISATTPRPNSAAYTATKHAITGLTKSLSLDGREFNIACGQIDIGNAQTELATKVSQGARQANGSTMVEPMMKVQHVADAIVYMASLPSDANVLSMTVMANAMPFVGRG